MCTSVSRFHQVIQKTHIEGGKIIAGAGYRYFHTLRYGVTFSPRIFSDPYIAAYFHSLVSSHISDHRRDRASDFKLVSVARRRGAEQSISQVFPGCGNQGHFWSPQPEIWPSRAPPRI